MISDVLNHQFSFIEVIAIMFAFSFVNAFVFWLLLRRDPKRFKNFVSRLLDITYYLAFAFAVGALVLFVVKQIS